jgi:hypothetical protein
MIFEIDATHPSWHSAQRALYFHLPGVQEELKEIFEETLAVLPEVEADPRQLTFEESRRRAKAKL